MDFISALWDDPAKLRSFGVILQRVAIAFVFVGGLIQVFKHVVDERVSSLNAAKTAKLEQERQLRENELEGKLKSSQEELGQVRVTASDLEKRLKNAEVVSPKMDASGRIFPIPFMSSASEFSTGIANALSLLTEERLDEAYIVAEELKKKREDFGLAYFVMGTVEARKGNLEPAEQLLKTAIEKGLPKDDEAWARNNLAVIYVRTGRLTDAVMSLEQAVALAPGNAQFKNSLDEIKSLRP